MELLSEKQQEIKQEVKRAMIVEHDSELVKAAKELYEWIGDDSKAALEEVLFYWLQNYDGDMEERSSTIFKFRRLIAFTETLAKIESNNIKQNFIREEIKESVN